MVKKTNITSLLSRLSNEKGQDDRLRASQNKTKDAARKANKTRSAKAKKGFDKRTKLLDKRSENQKKMDRWYGSDFNLSSFNNAELIKRKAHAIRNNLDNNGNKIKKKQKDK
jgi:uncharacterized membrane protein YcjF (UPF0283 family)